MFVTHKVSFRKNPATFESHAIKNANLFDEMQRFKRFFERRADELKPISEAWRELDSPHERLRNPADTLKLYEIIEAEHPLLLDEWVADPGFAIKELKEFQKTWFRMVTNQGWTDPAGWNAIDLLKARECVCGVLVYLSRVIERHESRTLHGPRTSWNTCTVSVSQMITERILQSLLLFRSCVDQMTLTFFEAWSLLKPNLQYRIVEESRDWGTWYWPANVSCTTCGAQLHEGDHCVEVEGTQGSHGLVCSSCIENAWVLSDIPEGGE